MTPGWPRAPTSPWNGRQRRFRYREGTGWGQGCGLRTGAWRLPQRGGSSERVTPAQAAPHPPSLLGHLCFPAGPASPAETKPGSSPVHSTSDPAQHPVPGGSIPAGCWPRTLARPREGDATPLVTGLPRSRTHGLSPVSRWPWLAGLSHAALRGTERMSLPGRETCSEGVSTGGTRDSWPKRDTAFDPEGTADATLRAGTLCCLPCPLFPASTGTRNSVCPFPLPAAAHLHAGDTRGAIFAIDARETLRKREESLGLTPPRRTERLVVGAKNGWEGKGKLHPCTEHGSQSSQAGRVLAGCTEAGCKDTGWPRTGQRRTKRSSPSPCKQLSPRCGHGCCWLYLRSPPWGRCLLGGP